jgi:hypothetical protein
MMEVLQPEVTALVAARNLGDPMKLLPNLPNLTCNQLADELIERRRLRDLFVTQIRIVGEQFTQLSSEVAIAVAVRDRRAQEAAAAAREVVRDEEILNECLKHGGHPGTGECTTEEQFLRRAEEALRSASAALAGATASLQPLQDRSLVLGQELLSLKADLAAIEDETSKILAAMQQKHCPIPPG